MNIQELNQLIPNPYREVNVPEAFLYYRSGIVSGISNFYSPENADFIFKYSKTGGVVSIEEISYNNLPQAFYTAEQWLDKNGIGGSRQPTLLYLKQSLLAAGKTSNELNLLENYLQTILGMYAIDPSPKNNWPNPPVTFEEAVSSAFDQLNN